MRVDPTKPRETPAMTPGRAALVVLMHRYLGGLMDPFVTLLEVHKLLYFIQEAGEPLRLRYAKAPYGPYAENLRHVLNAVEGHLVSGYQDGGDAPDKQLELVPGAVKDAAAFLADKRDTLDRFDRVGELVDGFETPFGLKLLATVHWVATREDARNAEVAVAKVHAWGDRKRRFSNRQIGIAFDALRSKGWLAAGVSARMPSGDNSSRMTDLHRLYLELPTAGACRLSPHPVSRRPRQPRAPDARRVSSQAGGDAHRRLRRAHRGAGATRRHDPRHRQHARVRARAGADGGGLGGVMAQDVVVRSTIDSAAASLRRESLDFAAIAVEQ